VGAIILFIRAGIKAIISTTLARCAVAITTNMARFPKIGLVTTVVASANLSAARVVPWLVGIVRTTGEDIYYKQCDVKDACSDTFHCSHLTYVVTTLSYRRPCPQSRARRLKGLWILLDDVIAEELRSLNGAKHVTSGGLRGGCVLR
jgi:hypothetical protein